MKVTKQISLINGVFAEPDAKEVIVNLIENKIRFHHLKILSTMERFGKVDIDSEMRINELRAAKELIIEMVQKPESSDIKYKITSDITIERL